MLSQPGNAFPACFCACALRKLNALVTMPTVEGAALPLATSADRCRFPVPVPATHSGGNKDQISALKRPPAIRGAISFRRFCRSPGCHRLPAPRVQFLAQLPTPLLGRRLQQRLTSCLRTLCPPLRDRRRSNPVDRVTAAAADPDQTRSARSGWARCLALGEGEWEGCGSRKSAENLGKWRCIGVRCSLHERTLIPLASAAIMSAKREPICLTIHFWLGSLIREQ